MLSIIFVSYQPCFAGVAVPDNSLAAYDEAEILATASHTHT